MSIKTIIKKKKKLIIIVSLLLVLLIAAVITIIKFIAKPAPVTEETSNKKRITEPVNIIAIAERPYIQIAPEPDGRHMMMIVKSIKKPATSVDYELEYQAGTLLQVALNNLKLEQIPAETQIMFGTCSAGGACSYHTDIKGGSLLTRFQGDENYALKSNWKYIDNQNKEAEISSKDGKFQINSTELAQQRYIVIFNSPGYPGEIEQTIVSDPYSLATSSSLTGKAQLSIRANEAGDLVIIGYNGEKWIEFESTVDSEDDKMVKAEVDLMELYLVVKK